MLSLPKSAVAIGDFNSNVRILLIPETLSTAKENEIEVRLFVLLVFLFNICRTKGISILSMIILIKMFISVRLCKLIVKVILLRTGHFPRIMDRVLWVGLIFYHQTWNSDLVDRLFQTHLFTGQFCPRGRMHTLCSGNDPCWCDVS